MRQGGRKIIRQQAAAAVYISVGVFFIKMLWEEVTSPAWVFITAEMEAEALCQRECKVVLAARAFHVLARALRHLAMSVFAAHGGRKASPFGRGRMGKGTPPAPHPAHPPGRQSQLPARCPGP